MTGAPPYLKDHFEACFTDAGAPSGLSRTSGAFIIQLSKELYVFEHKT